MIYNSNGSWKNAEEECDHIGSKLWAINSFAEWIHVSSSFGNVAINSNQTKDMKVNLIRLSSTVLLFIGQQGDSQVRPFEELINNTEIDSILILNLYYRTHGMIIRHTFMITTGHYTEDIWTFYKRQKIYTIIYPANTTRTISGISNSNYLI